MKTKYKGIVIDRKIGIIVLNSHKNVYSLSKEISKEVNKKVYIVCGIWWSIESVVELLKALGILYKNFLFYPNIKISILCNTERELKLLKFFGVEAIFCNQNCFVDEKIFNVQNETEKRFDAVYNAVLSKFKRHELARNIDKLCLVTYNFKNIKYKKYIDQLIKNAFWANYVTEEPKFLNNYELCNEYNKAKVALALSKIEGSMYASNEYLLCGLPVVTTKSKGGRDVFYTNENSITTKPNAKDVEKAVQDLIAKNMDPNKIRKVTLDLMLKHREKFVDHINSIIRKENYNYDISETWDDWFVHKLRKEMFAKEIIELLNDKVEIQHIFN